MIKSTQVSQRLLLTLTVSVCLCISGCSERRSSPAPTAPASTVTPSVANPTTTPLHTAAASGSVETVASLVRGGADVNARDEGGRTPLHHAAVGGHGQTVAKLLELGADASIRDSQGHNARYYAEQGGHSETAGRLSVGGPSANASPSIESPATQSSNPSLKYADAESFGQAIGQPACLLSSNHVRLFAPKTREREAGIVFPYLVKAYDALYEIVGRHTEHDIVVYNFPKGHADAFGGTSNCVLYYDDTNLQLDTQEEWRVTGVPHVSGYIEEMAHNFVSGTRAQFGWEMIGWSIGVKVSEMVANNPIFARHIQDTRNIQYETCQRFAAGGWIFPADIEGNLVDRIHAFILYQCEQDYGPTFWHDFFKEVKKEHLALLTAAKLEGDKSRDARYEITLTCFDRLPGLGFKDRLRAAHISLEKDIKSLHPTEPSWNRRLA